MMGFVNTSRDRHDLQRCLELLSLYIKRNGLAVNAAKSKAMKIGARGKVKSVEDFSLEGSTIEYVPEFTYLGVVFSRKSFSFSAHIKERIRKALVAFRMIPNRQKLSLRAATALFNIYVAPV